MSSRPPLACRYKGMANGPERERLFSDSFVGALDVGVWLVVAAVFFGVWMLGVFLGDLHSVPTAVHIVGGVIAFVGAIPFFVCVWLAYRAWRLQGHS